MILKLDICVSFIFILERNVAKLTLGSEKMWYSNLQKNSKISSAKSILTIISIVKLLHFELLQKDIFRAGTVRANWKYLPKAPQVKPDEAMERGKSQVFEAKGIHFVIWIDNKAVLMLSNFISVHPLKEVKRRKKGTSTSEMVSCPAVIQLQNKYTGEEDIMDKKKTTSYQFDQV